MYRNAGTLHLTRICINVQCGVQRRNEFTPQTGNRRSPVGSGQDYVYVYLYVCPTVCPVVSIDFGL